MTGTNPQQPTNMEPAIGVLSVRLNAINPLAPRDSADTVPNYDRRFRSLPLCDHHNRSMIGLQQSVAHFGHRAELREFWIEEDV
jgi:hypothetical protein